MTNIQKLDLNQLKIHADMSEYEREQWLDSGMPLTSSMGPCVICGERVWDWTDPAEMHNADMLADPDMWSETEGGIVHADCGLGKGWVQS